MARHRAGLLQIGRAGRRPGARLPAAGRLHGPGVHQPTRTAGRAAASTGWSAWTPTPTSAGGSTPGRVLAFSAGRVLLLYGSCALQAAPAARRGLPAWTPAMACNTAVSFVTNTNWQCYCRRVDAWATSSRWPAWRCRTSSRPRSASPSRSRWSAASPGRSTDRLGNFWVDLVRGHRPGPAAARVVVGRRARRRRRRAELLRRHHDVTTLAGAAQTIPGGPVASQEAIKELGTNGGGFYNANSAHPFENPNPLTNLFEIFLLLLIPFALPRTFGLMVGGPRQGYAILAVMAALWAGVLVGRHDVRGRRAPAPRRQAAGAAMEGKEVRFGDGASALFAASTTGTSTGAVNSLPRQLHRARRRRHAAQHDARRGRARRGRRRPVRDARAGRRSRCSSPA